MLRLVEVALVNKTPINAEAYYKPGIWVIRRSKILFFKLNSTVINPESIKIFYPCISLETTDSKMQECIYIRPVLI